MARKLNSICVLFGHSYKYNFPNVPNKRICETCGQRERLNMNTLQWVIGFKDKRTNAEIIKKWHN